MQVRPSVLLAAVLLGGAAASAAEVELDDPGARLRATRAWYGEDVAGRARILDAAGKERDRYAIGQSGGGSRANALSATSTSAFVNLGPTRADFAVNGDTYAEIDSGRVRQILAHPMDPDVLFIATAGGGVWKTYTATAPTVLWEPLTDALGSTAVGTLAMDPSNPDILFLGFGDPFDVQQPGITRSTDGGGTWSAPAILTATYPVGSTNRNLIAGTVTDLKADPRNSAIVLATTDAGLFRSTNGGAGWAHVPLVVSGASRYYYMWSLAWVGNDTWLAAGQTVADQQPVYGRLFQTPFADRIRHDVGMKTMAVGNISSYMDVNTIIAAGPQPLGRLLTGGANVTVNLIRPGTLYSDRRTNLDFRVAKIIRYRRTRTQVGVDIYNATNTDVVTGFNQAFSPTSTTWLTPTSIQPARYVKLNAQVDF